MNIRKKDGWKCNYCKETFNTRKELKDHGKKYHYDFKGRKKGGWHCIKCGEVLNTKHELEKHNYENHFNEKLNRKKGGWNCNCGLNFKTRKELFDHREECSFFKRKENGWPVRIKLELTCKFCKKIFFTTKCNMSYHENSCEKNPNKIKRKGHKLSDETKKKLSDSLKIAFKEGRNKGWIKSYGQTASYPERFFKKVFENDFIDKNFEINLPVHLYFLDFAWKEKMKVIEIDGQQHYRTKEAQEYDKKRDLYLINLGWKILRIKWIDVLKDTQKYIKEAYNFIH